MRCTRTEKVNTILSVLPGESASSRRSARADETRRRSCPFFAHFTPFFAHFLRLGARKPGSAKERRKNGGKRAQNGVETGVSDPYIPHLSSPAPMRNAATTSPIPIHQESGGGDHSFLRPFSTVTEPAHGLLVPLSGILASRRRPRKNEKKRSKNGPETA